MATDKPTGMPLTQRPREVQDAPEPAVGAIESMIALLQGELARLKEELEFWRSSNAPDRKRQIRLRVNAIDERHDALEKLLGTHAPVLSPKGDVPADVH